MITVTILTQEDGKITGFSAEGHSGTAPRGEDIVCAGVSSLTDSAYLGITEYLHRNVISKDSSGKLHMVLEGRPDERTEAILETMLLGLTAIAEAYPRALRITKSQAR
ncbi:ribosomal-processing cysteine protease Prp [Selenomonas sp.]|jgi:uncharacterized protein YsxB (DUF464 family)|uniref:ribosomal-processing cysteine protease Prp n=1 Tax=Selenomonas sp. TaxID=2053611 RepID=UPI0025CFD677|nr:ribosomal-processing cysteine protease Prp [Selenomonas sp.]MCI6283519.1 ribosomal-processing cysteine protease Prp [Selenomonas sp.]